MNSVATSTYLTLNQFQNDFFNVSHFIFSIWSIIFKIMLLWVIIIIVAGAIGLMIYLLVTRRSRTKLLNSNSINMEPTQQVSPAMSTGHLKTSGFAITSLVLGIVSLLPNPMLGIPCGVLALVFGLIARNKIKQGLLAGSGLSTAGVTLGIIGLIISILVITLFASLFAGLAGSFKPTINMTTNGGFQPTTQNNQVPVSTQ